MRTLLRSLKSMNKIKTTEPKVIWKIRCKLGEGTLWVKEHNSIYFVDIKKQKFFSLNIKTNKKKIYKVDKNLLLTKVDTNYRITNGPAFIDQYNFYHTDSPKKKIYKIKIDKNDKIISKKIFKKLSPKDGSPDGMTLDKYKNLWVAHFNGARVSVFNKNAKLIHRINLPAQNITNCAFGGQNNNELFITSATKGMNKAGLQKFRYSGFLFSVKTNSKGILQKKFILSHEKKRSLL